MRSNFTLLGPVHIAILSAIPACAASLAWLARQFPPAERWIRLALAVFLLLNACLWYGYLAWRHWLSFPGTLPLDLCDATLCLTIVALFTRSSAVFDLAYYGALAGTSMALLTPDLWEPFPSFSTVDFFVTHGMVQVAVLYLIGARQARPRPGSVWRAMLALNVFAVAVGAFDWIFATNYMYLRAKPGNPSLLDFLGPWPWYILSSEGIALALFILLYLPFSTKRPRRRPPGSSSNSRASLSGL
ncbi:MAG: TIGR02206 family membrane protein [Terracidiphilus sp.]